MAKDNGSNSIRPSWDDYFLELADAASRRATCDRGKSGCVIVRDKQVLATGYVGSPTGLPHCDDVGHLMKKVIQENGEISEHCLRTVHAEQNAICQAASSLPVLGNKKDPFENEIRTRLKELDSSEQFKDPVMIEIMMAWKSLSLTLY